MGETKKIKIIAHRGASSLAPENTLASIQKALEFSPDYIELDIRLTKDLQLAVLHDASLKRTGGLRKTIHQLTMEEAKECDIGSWFGPEFTGQKVPRLEEVLELVGNKAGLMIEMKQGIHPPEVIINKLFETLKNFSYPMPKLVIGGFSHTGTLLAKREADKIKNKFDIKIIGLAENIRSLTKLITFDIDIIGAWHRILTAEAIKAIQASHKEAWTFTVNDERLAKKLIGFHIDGIITNFPQAFKN